MLRIYRKTIAYFMRAEVGRQPNMMNNFIVQRSPFRSFTFLVKDTLLAYNEYTIMSPISCQSELEMRSSSFSFRQWRT